MNDYDYWETKDERIGLLLNGAGIDLTLWDETNCTRLTIGEFVDLVNWASVILSRFRRYTVVIKRSDENLELQEISLYAHSPRCAVFWAVEMACPAIRESKPEVVADSSQAARFIVTANGCTWGTVELHDVSRLPVGYQAGVAGMGNHQDEADLDDLNPLLDCLEIARSSLSLGETLAEKCDHPIAQHVQAAHNCLILPVSHLKRRVEEKSEDKLFLMMRESVGLQRASEMFPGAARRNPSQEPEDS